MSRIARSFGLALAALLAVGCAEEAPIVDYAFIGPEDGGDSLPALDSPFTPEETTELRSGFDWSETVELPETDDEGRPTLYYTIILVATREQADVLKLARVYHDPMPLFPEELEPWDEAGPGTVDFVGDDHGTFVFAFLPGAVYNEIRRTALDGEPVFEVVRLRDVPDPAARLPAGYLDLDVLIERGCTLGFPDEELEAELAGSGAPLATAEPKFFGLIVRAIIWIGQQIADAFQQLVTVFRLKRDFSFRMRVVNSDALFFGGPPERPETIARHDQILRQGWGQHVGRPLVPRGAEIVVRTNLGITIRDLRSTGEVAMRIPRDKSFSIFLRLRNDAATITAGGVWARRVLLGRGNFGESDRSKPVHVVRDILDRSVHELTLLTEARDFAGRQLGHWPRRAIVVDGPVDSETRQSSTPCWSFFGFGTTAFGGGRGWSLAAGVFSIFSDWDMVIRDDDGASRGIVTHEYGHFVMCDMFRDVSRRDFGRAYGEVIQDATASRGLVYPGDEARIVAEAWADFYAAQVVGGTNYFTTDGTASTSSRGMSYCSARTFGPAFPCTEDNVGAPLGVFRDMVTDITNAPAEQPLTIGTLTTLMVDAFDETAATPAAINAGVRWELTDEGSSPSLGAGLPDEVVSLPGRDLIGIVKAWSHSSNRLHLGPFYSAIATVLLSKFDESEVCEVFALHDPNGDCGALASVLEPFAPPFQLTADSRLDAAGTTPIVDGEWTLLDPSATHAFVELVVDGSTLETEDEPYSMHGTWSSTGPIPFDAPAILRVAPSLGSGPEGEFASRSLRTPAEPVTVASAAGSLWSIHVSWTATQATSYIVRTRRRSDPSDETWTPTSSASASVTDLEPDEVYDSVVFSVNALGELCPIPSPTVSATPMDIHPI